MSLPVNAREFAADWVAAWNAHDLERILAHYAANVALTSPVAARVLGNPAGVVTGIDALRSYFGKGLALFPNLKFTLIDVMQGLSSVVLYYENQSGTHTGEFMEFNSDGKVARVVANYGV
ncbi:MAG: nuclear transport factor 2 family protein [Terracidiphilus sp.]